MDIWEIRLNSDECQYCESPLLPDAIYTCKYPGKSYNKECEEGICPVAVLTPAAPDSEGQCEKCKGFVKSIYHNYCANCGKELPHR